MDKKPLKWLILGGALRYYLATSDWGTILANRVEIATPLNSFKRGKMKNFRKCKKLNY